MEFGLWSTLILIVLVLIGLVGLCLLQIPLARRRAWWPGLIQPALWLASALSVTAGFLAAKLLGKVWPS